MKKTSTLILLFLIFPLKPIFAQSKISNRKKSDNYCELADNELKNKNYDKAIELTSEAIKFDPKNFYAFFLKGYAELCDQKSEMALYDFNKSVLINPNFAGSYRYKGILEQHDDPAKAMEDYSSAIKASTDPKSLAIYYEDRASVKADLLDWQGALEDCNKSLKYYSADNFAAYTLRAKINLECGNYNSAISDCNSSIHIIPGVDFNPYYIRGMAEIKIGKSDSACEDFAKAKELMSNYPKLNEAIRKYCN